MNKEEEKDDGNTDEEEWEKEVAKKEQDGRLQ